MNFRKIVTLVGIQLAILSCATNQRTKYAPSSQSNQGGYLDAAFAGGTLIARFSGNAHTHKIDAILFSKFRAIENCLNKGFKVARLLGTNNLSTSKTVTKSSSYNYKAPTNFSGTYSGNSNYSSLNGNTIKKNTNASISGQAYGGHSFGSGSTWNETYKYPVFDTFFTCQNSINIAGIKMQKLASSKIHKYSKDYLDAVQIVNMLDTSANVGNLKTGDIILEINGERIQEQSDVTLHIDKNKEGEPIKVLIVRKENTKLLELKTKDITKEVWEQNRRILISGCSVDEIKNKKICKDLVTE